MTRLGLDPFVEAARARAATAATESARRLADALMAGTLGQPTEARRQLGQAIDLANTARSCAVSVGDVEAQAAAGRALAAARALAPWLETIVAPAPGEGPRR